MLNPLLSGSHTRTFPRAAREGPRLNLTEALLASQHGLGLTLQVNVGVAADVDRDPPDSAAGEVVR